MSSMLVIVTAAAAATVNVMRPVTLHPLRSQALIVPATMPSVNGTRAAPSSVTVDSSSNPGCKDGDWR
ncbi:hypothetical protein ACFWWM_42455 [Streptomyces sp. NPDC058682]|uniref:hypothetical protein n=1 Tax=Streptomyces sp. NPDC058682 TaxID=3346596 RepID=UPI003647F364